MPTNFKIQFTQSRSATAIEVTRLVDLAAALEAIGLSEPKITFAIIGGAGNFEPAEMQAVAPFLTDIFLKILHHHDCYVLDGGTDSGLMQLVGQMRFRAPVKFPLIGVATRRTVILPTDSNPAPDAVPLEPNHSHFILVPGTQWGDESPWISQSVSLLARGKPALTLLINGGEISRADVQHSLDAGRPVIALAGSGRLADELALLKNKPTLLKIIKLNEPAQKILRDLESILRETKDE